MLRKIGLLFVVLILTALPLLNLAVAPAAPPVRSGAAPRVHPTDTRYLGPYDTRQQAEAAQQRFGQGEVVFIAGSISGISGKWWVRWEQIH